ncbi:MAG: SGNH/GDSL hydrolase family protein [Candidatus Hinthialibacter sp.]
MKFLKQIRRIIKKHPVLILLASLTTTGFCAAEIHFSHTHGFASTIDAFVIDFDTLWSNRPHTSFTREDKYGQEISYGYNSQGFRRRDASEEISLQKSPGAKRIILLGDSTTNGHGVAFDETYAEILNQMFGSEAEVFSCAVPGFSAVQCRIQFERKILSYQPDLITVAVNYNDRRGIYDRNQADDEIYFYYASRIRYISEMLTRHVALINAWKNYRIASLEKRLADHPPRLDELSCRVPPSVFQKNLEMICDLAQRENIQVVLIGLGDSFELFDHIFSCRAAETLEEKVHYLQKERSEKSFYTYGLATLLLVDLIKQNEDGAEGLDPQKLLTSYQPVISALGGFVIKPDWIYREAMKQAAQNKNVPYFNFADYARSRLEASSDATPIYISDDPVHLNPQGHRMLAEALFPILKNEIEKDRSSLQENIVIRMGEEGHSGLR